MYFAETTNESLLDDKLYRLELTLPDGKEARSTTTMVESSVGPSTSRRPTCPTTKWALPQSTRMVLRLTPISRSSGPRPLEASLYTASLVVHFEERYYADDALTLLDSAPGPHHDPLRGDP